MNEADLLATCPNCGYALTGLPVEHRCPECGAQVDRRVKVFGRRTRLHKIMRTLYILFLCYLVGSSVFMVVSVPIRNWLSAVFPYVFAFFPLLKWPSWFFSRGYLLIGPTGILIMDGPKPKELIPWTLFEKVEYGTNPVRVHVDGEPRTLQTRTMSSFEADRCIQAINRAAGKYQSHMPREDAQVGRDQVADDDEGGVASQ